MGCSFNGERIKMHLKITKTRLSMLLSENREEQAVTPLTRSALQNPDVSRYELERLLRKSEQQTDNNGWNRFFAATQGNCANSNAAT